MYKIISAFVFVGVTLIGFAYTADALTISPARLELAGDPGKTISGEFLLINEQESTQTFYSSAENFESQGETGTPSFTSAKEGLATWISVDPQITLEKGEQKKIPFTITIPQGADAGGHFAAIFLSTAPTNAEQGQVAVGAKIGVLVLLRVSGDIKEGGGITDFDTTTGKRFFTSLPINFTYKFNNTGNDRVNPTGTLSIRNSLFIKTDELQANPTQGNILPGSTRRFDVTWGKNEDLKNKNFFGIALYQFQHFALGLYTAKLDISYGTSGTADASKMFFVFPWQLIVLLIPALLILFFIFSTLLKKYNQWVIRKARNIQ
jgi:hypothetical protein